LREETCSAERKQRSREVAGWRRQ